MKFIDLHCDTLSKVMEHPLPGVLERNSRAVDFTGMEEAGCLLQVFASFLNLGGYPEAEREELAWQDALAMNHLFREEAARAGRIVTVTSADSLVRAEEKGRLCALLSIEEGGILNQERERLNVLHERGVRLITLTWNYENCIGYPNIIPKYRQKGLKPFGLDVVSRMEELGMIIDVSHLSDGGFEDVFSHSKRPFIASHSNAREILNHPRNLTDEMIRKIAEKGGVIGLNFGGEFLQKTGRSTVEAMLPHIRHIQNVGGHEVLAIGTDFDGVEEDMEIRGCQDMPYLIQALERHGLSASEIGGICYENAEKFLKRYWEN